MDIRQNRIGIIVPSNNTVIEPETDHLLAHSNVSVRVARLPVQGIDQDQLLQMSSQTEGALRELVRAGVDVIVYACLSTSLAKDLAWETEFNKLVDEATPCPRVTAAYATVTALRVLGTRCVSVVSPYPRQLHQRLPRLFHQYGIRVVSDVSLGISDLDEIGRTDPRVILARAQDIVTESTEALCVVATDLPTVELIEPLERISGLPVVTTNQAMIWWALSTLGFATEVEDAGRLFRQGVPDV